MSDGRLPPGPLLSVLREHLSLNHDLDLIDLVLNQWKGRRSEVAALSKVVVDAAERGDECAHAILRDAGVELSKLVRAVADRVGFREHEQIPVSYSGGVFNVEVVLRSFEQAVMQLGRAYEVRAPLLDPVTGAAIYAAKRAGVPLDDAAMQRLWAKCAPCLEK